MSESEQLPIHPTTPPPLPPPPPPPPPLLLPTLPSPYEITKIGQTEPSISALEQRVKEKLFTPPNSPSLAVVASTTTPPYRIPQANRDQGSPSGGYNNGRNDFLGGGQVSRRYYNNQPQRGFSNYSPGGSNYSPGGSNYSPGGSNYSPGRNNYNNYNNNSYSPTSRTWNNNYRPYGSYTNYRGRGRGGGGYYSNSILMNNIKITSHQNESKDYDPNDFFKKSMLFDPWANLFYPDNHYYNGTQSDNRTDMKVNTTNVSIINNQGPSMLQSQQEPLEE
ncbi:hypothetical protein G9A89_014434 [Geosiphon pyriformis]|nr:hypothetical protein G9A89_014434 [Geosiphon pyriformis]